MPCGAGSPALPNFLRLETLSGSAYFENVGGVIGGSVLADTTSVAGSGFAGRVLRNRMLSEVRSREISPRLQYSTRGEVLYR